MRRKITRGRIHKVLKPCFLRKRDMTSRPEHFLQYDDKITNRTSSFPLLRSQITIISENPPPQYFLFSNLTLGIGDIVETTDVEVVTFHPYSSGIDIIEFRSQNQVEIKILSKGLLEDQVKC